MHHPQDASRKLASGEISEAEIHTKPTFEKIQEEIAEKRGFSVDGKSPEEMILQDDLLKTMPMGKIAKPVHFTNYWAYIQALQIYD